MPPETIGNIVDLGSFRIPAVWRAAAEPRATVLLLPALGTAAGYYGPFTDALCEEGFNVLSPELPGTGESRPCPCRGMDYGYRDLVEDYLPSLACEAGRRGGGAPLLIAGHSLGGHVCALGVLSGRVKPAAFVSLASGDIHYRNWPWPRSMTIYLVGAIASVLSLSLGYVPGQLLGFRGAQAGTLMREWSRFIRSGQLPLPVPPFAGGAPVRTLCVGFEGDLLAPPESVSALANRLRADSQSIPVDWPGQPHFAWARHPRATVRQIQRWLDAAGIVR